MSRATTFDEAVTAVELAASYDRRVPFDYLPSQQLQPRNSRQIVGGNEIVDVHEGRVNAARPSGDAIGRELRSSLKLY